MVFTAFKREEGHCGIGLPAIGRLSHRQFCPLDAHAVDAAVAEKDHDIAVEEIAAGVECQSGVGTETVTIGADRVGQWKIDAVPALAAVSG